MMDYPPQEPFSAVGQAYHDRVVELGRGVGPGREIAYGPDRYQRLSLYPAERADAPVLAFIHGGGWTNGYKEWMAFMAPAVTAAGIGFATIGYRLAPAHVFPAGLDDVADGIVRLMAETGNAPLFAGGHSAGGHYAALLAVQDGWWRARGLTANPLKGCLPVSGVYRFGEGAGMAMRPRFLGPEGTETAASPVLTISDRTPFLIAHGDRDFPHLMTQAAEMETALQARGIEATRLVLPDCDHFGASYHAGDPAGTWLGPARAFIERHSQ